MGEHSWDRHCIFTSGTYAEPEMRCPRCRPVDGDAGGKEQGRREDRVKALDADCSRQMGF